LTIAAPIAVLRNDEETSVAISGSALKSQKSQGVWKFCLLAVTEGRRAVEVGFKDRSNIRQSAIVEQGASALLDELAKAVRRCVRGTTSASNLVDQVIFAQLCDLKSSQRFA